MNVQCKGTELLNSLILLHLIMYSYLYILPESSCYDIMIRYHLKCMVKFNVIYIYLQKISTSIKKFQRLHAQVPVENYTCTLIHTMACPLRWYVYMVNAIKNALAITRNVSNTRNACSLALILGREPPHCCSWPHPHIFSRLCTIAHCWELPAVIKTFEPCFVTEML